MAKCREVHAEPEYELTLSRTELAYIKRAILDYDDTDDETYRQIWDVIRKFDL